MIVLKLIIITLFLYLSSKSFGLLIVKKFNLSKEISLCLGYFFNIALYFIIIFVPMFFKLSSTFLTVFSLIYLCICFYSLFYSVKQKELFIFEKKEIIAIIISLIFTILFALFIDFGAIEMYDTYFYSVFTNSATKVDALSTINSYTGYPDLQNYYKYISIYYQASFFAKLFNIVPAYLVLIWPFTFINYFILSSTSLSFVRVSKNNSFNNILTIFLLTFYTSFFRAPFNSLYMINIVFSIYLIKFAFDSFKNKKIISLYYILFIAATACSSIILYASAILIYILFIINCINKKNDFITIFKLALPTYILGILYIFSGIKNLLVLIIALAILIVIYCLIKFKITKLITKVLGFVLMISLPIIFTLLPKASFYNKIIDIFVVNEQTVIEDPRLQCISDNITTTIELPYDASILSTSMSYIYGKNSSKINTILIYITHSIFLYGGLLFLFIYGIIKLRKNNYFIAFIVYLFTFFNPFMSEGLSQLLFGFNDRIYLFFNTFFAIIGLKYFFEWIYSFKNKIINKILSKVWIIYVILLILSIISYISILKTPNWYKNNFLYKVSNELIISSNDINTILTKKNNNPRVLYLPEVFNLTLIDENPNNKYKVIDSREYKEYYFDTSIINNKMLLNIYFESNGKIDISSIVNNDYNNCDIIKLLTYYNIDYIILGKKNEQALNQIFNNYKIIYDKNNVIVVERYGDFK